jgi:subtilase family protein
MFFGKFRLGLAALSLGLAIGGAAKALPPAEPKSHVTPQGPVQFTHGVYHRAVCSHAHLPIGMMACHAHMRTDARGNIMIGKAASASPAYQPAGYGAFDLRSAYIVNGKGVAATKIAVVDAYGYPRAQADLAIYRAQMGLPVCTAANGCFKKVNQNGGTAYPAFDAGWAQETALDLDMVSAMCPNCHIVLVQANSAFLSDLAVAENQAVLQGAHVISNSYGGSEIGTTGYEPAWNHAGVAITVSTGDDGFGVQFPASSPHVTAVGGTNLVRSWNARGWKETAWTGAGSGCSTIYAKPAWQSDILCATRMSADVSAVADPETGVAVYVPIDSVNSVWTVFGGTSASAPIVAGVYGVNGGAVNYGQNPYLHLSGLFDVKSGSNGTCGGTYFCTSAVGYDGPTGLGSPYGATAF